MVIAKLYNLNNLYLSHNKITVKCVWEYLKMENLKVLDVRFNLITQEERDIVKGTINEQIQLFL